MRLRRPLVSLLAVVAIALPAATAVAAPAGVRAVHECQHPVGTGAEAYDLHRVTVAVACPVVLDLYAWEVKGNETKLYSCKGTKATLKRASFEGWALSLDANGDFRMSRGASWFHVGGTDFPVGCF